MQYEDSNFNQREAKGALRTVPIVERRSLRDDEVYEEFAHCNEQKSGEGSDGRLEICSECVVSEGDSVVGQ